LKPYFTVVGGPNGSGKSTLTSANLDSFADIPILDPDAVARVIAADYHGDSTLEAGRRVLLQLQEFLMHRRSVSVETTLAGKWVFGAMRQAREFNYIIGLVFVGTSSPDINVTRVQRRVELGGHSVPEQDIRRRYVRSLLHLPKALALADQALLFDNSSTDGYRLIGSLRDRQFWWSDDLPEWALPSYRLVGV